MERCNTSGFDAAGPSAWRWRPITSRGNGSVISRRLIVRLQLERLNIYFACIFGLLAAVIKLELFVFCMFKQMLSCLSICLFSHLFLPTASFMNKLTWINCCKLITLLSLLRVFFRVPQAPLVFKAWLELLVRLWVTYLYSLGQY